MTKRKHHIGDRFGRLVNVKPYTTKKGGKWFHLMRCDCGNEKEVRGVSLTRGHSTSCGCLLRDISTTHGDHGSPEYIAWGAMKTRCRNANQPGYENYGGRGITFCERWDEFENFLSDMGRKPSQISSLERIDNDKGYSPSNCKWATRREQSVNQRLRADNKTGYKGVSYRPKQDRYYASICVNKERIHIGCFRSIGDAVAARKHEEAKYIKSED